MEWWEWLIIAASTVTASGLCSGLVATLVTHRLQKRAAEQQSKENLYAELLTQLQMYPTRLSLIDATRASLIFPRYAISTRDKALEAMLGFAQALHRLSLSESTEVIVATRRPGAAIEDAYALIGRFDKQAIENLTQIVQREIPTIRDAMRHELGRGNFPP